jgi:hypothetical protein
MAAQERFVMGELLGPTQAGACSLWQCGHAARRELGDPAFELRGYEGRVIGDQPGAALPDQSREHALCITEQQDRPQRAEILERLGGQIALVLRMVALQEEQDVGLRLPRERLPVGDTNSG